MADKIQSPIDILVNDEDLLEPLDPSVLNQHQAVPTNNNDEDLNDEWVVLEPMPMPTPMESLEKELKNCSVENNKEIIEEKGNESNSEPDYIVIDDSNTTNDQLYSREISEINGKFLTYPKHSNGEYMCNITVINNLNTLELNIVWDEYTSRLYEPMFEELQSESTNMLPLNGIFENKACIAVYPEDGRWYRASILQFSERKSLVKVKYVDYGNIGVISLADTREICEEWAKLPPATITAKLFGVRLNPDTDMGIIIKKYAQVFLDKGPFQVNIMGYEDQVPLVELRNENTELTYMKLIEDNIFIKCD